MCPKTDDKSIIDKCCKLQAECYDYFGKTSAPIDDREYDRMVDWMADQLEKMTIYDLLDEGVRDGCSERGAYMAANAVERILREEDDGK